MFWKPDLGDFNSGWNSDLGSSEPCALIKLLNLSDRQPPYWNTNAHDAKLQQILGRLNDIKEKSKDAQHTVGAQRHVVIKFSEENSNIPFKGIRKTRSHSVRMQQLVLGADGATSGRVPPCLRVTWTLWIQQFASCQMFPNILQKFPKCQISE